MKNENDGEMMKSLGRFAIDVEERDCTNCEYDYKNVFCTHPFGNQLCINIEWKKESVIPSKITTVFGNWKFNKEKYKI